MPVSSPSLIDEPLFEMAVAARLVAAGYPRCEPKILQPAAIFFDSGEDLRGQLYLTSDISGADYCLRPEYTIPVSRLYLDSPQAGSSAGFSYCGPVFRYRGERPSEFIQAGIESFGRQDREAADAEILGLALEAVGDFAERLSVRITDVGLFTALLDALELPPPWRRRLLRAQVLGTPFDMIFAPTGESTQTDHSGVLALLDGADRQGARALVEDLLSIAGFASISGRTPAEIADRFLEQAALKSSQGLASEKRQIIERFLAIEGDPDQASEAMRRLLSEAGLDLTSILDSFDARLGFIAARGLDVSSLHFATRFTRNLDYYTGFVFEAHDRLRPQEKPVIGGGRYDKLLRQLGAPQDISAVGAAIWIEALDAMNKGGAA
ncbi:ATP phosphoribosyltransferase regulatory subunit [Beijerinckia indica]|uniref:tRNA synthetase class II (G H P and S) n=1 Tax=Beijerinckia indica subsp. indica (strain ATCC 9039 / DSM 1715 / NCIMB 8712) TaxID=395963 RepID=B2ICW9_BEII9|nr:ATP phosphoribosyltransferase regulatory subunit [Beijerinckia indica]ACB95403.1 tRNA synthetase class II (G H P and S) [Beijerinckia indica subsp. indica ATCC 9039]